MRVRIAPELVGVFLDRFGKSPPLSFDREKPGHLIVAVRVVNSPQFLAWILSLGSGAEILSPENVVGDMRRLIRDAAKKALRGDGGG